MVGLLSNDKGDNKFYALNETNGVQLPFSLDVHTAIAWIGQTACNESVILQQIATAGNTGSIAFPFLFSFLLTLFFFKDVNQLRTNCGKLNSNTSPYFDGGLVVVNNALSWTFICSRNNNFSNRSQKGIINSQTLVQTFGIVLLSVSAAAFAAAIVIALVVKFAPSSALAASAVGV
jgi:hypothetical protein